LLRLLPVVGLLGVLIPLLGLGLGRVLLGGRLHPAQWEMVEFWLMGVTVLYWSVFMTVLVGCTFVWALRRGKTLLFSPTTGELP